MGSYIPYTRIQKPTRGRPHKYGKKLKLMTLFDYRFWKKKFNRVETTVYRKQETIRYLTLDLLWKPTKGRIRFFLIETSRGRIILMTPDPTLDPIIALQLYCELFQNRQLQRSV